jgi:glucose-6-phosphate isomerase
MSESKQMKVGSGLLSDAPSYAAMVAHASTMQDTHIKTLMGDSARCGGMLAEHGGIALDFSRQKMTPETMGLLHQLYAEQGIAEKLAAMQALAALQHTSYT